MHGPWHIRPLDIRSAAEAAQWCEPGTHPPIPARYFLAHVVGRPAEPEAEWVAACRRVGAFACRGPEGIIIAGSDDALGRAAHALKHHAEQSPLGELLSAQISAVQNPPTIWVTHCGSIELSRPQVMGIVNVTPDSFFPGGRHPDASQAVDAALAMVEAGADILDIGGESTRPGAAAVSAAEEAARVVPVIQALTRQTPTPISVDTSKAAVATAALEAGAWIVNDVWALAADSAMASVAAQSGCGLVLMHSRGDSRTMTSLASYRSLMGEMVDELEVALGRATTAGVSHQRVVIDPGVGFAKTHQLNVQLLRRIGELRGLGCPILVGASRKSFLNQCFAHNIEERLEGSLAAAAAALTGGARIFRVHDVAQTRRLLDVAHAIETSAVSPSVDFHPAGGASCRI